MPQVCFSKAVDQNGWLHRSPSPNNEVAPATVAGRMRKREARHHESRKPHSSPKAMRHRANLVFLREIQAGVAELAYASQREGHGEPPLTQRFQAKGRVCTLLHEAPALLPAKPPHDGDAKGLDARVLLPHTPPLALNPLTTTDEGTRFGPSKLDPGSSCLKSTMHHQKQRSSNLASSREPGIPIYSRSRARRVTRWKQDKINELAYKIPTYPHPHQQ